jgi:ATP-dependent Lon protease
MPIGGLKEKLLAAHRNDIKTVLLPKENRKDLKEVPKATLRALRLVLVEHMDDVLREALAFPEPESVFGPRATHIVEYVEGKVVHPTNDDFDMNDDDEAGRPPPAMPPPGEQPAL